MVGEERASLSFGNGWGSEFYEELMGGGSGKNRVVEVAFGYIIGVSDEGEPRFTNGMCGEREREVEKNE